MESNHVVFNNANLYYTIRRCVWGTVIYQNSGIMINYTPQFWETFHKRGDSKSEAPQFTRTGVYLSAGNCREFSSREKKEKKTPSAEKLAAI
jgi:hypothetical protein